MATVAVDLEREPGAAAAPPAVAPPQLTWPAPAIAMPEQLAALATPQRAGAVAGLQRGHGNAAVARLLRPADEPKPAVARVGQRCKCGGTIGPDGQCDSCRAKREAGLAPEENGDEAIARMLATDAAARLRRQADDGAGAAGTETAAEEACTTRCGNIPAACPPPFCCPFPVGTATIIREQIRMPFLAAIGSQVTASVVPVWLTWFNGGAGMQNFTGGFGADFANDPTTAAVGSLLAPQVAADLDSAQLAQLAATAAPGASVSLLPALPANYTVTKTAALERDGDPLLMDFTTIGTAPGNLAGGVGKTQSSCSVGATPSPADDARVLTDVQATLVRNPNGSITVTPTLHFRVIDTVDLCPGNCGSGLGLINEQLATFPMSRLEASRVSGDVPFTVEFSTQQAAFTVPPPAPPVPQHVVVSARTLFDFGSHELRPGGEEALEAELGDRPANADLTQPFTVEGHTDNKGSEEFNQALSERRAGTVVAVLERRYPSVAGHPTPIGFGETRPIAPNETGGQDDPAGRAENRRVEMRFSAPPPP